VHRTVLVSALTLLSRVLGYARESIMAALFGDHSTITDAFTTAWRIPNLFRRLLGEGAISTSLQTSLTEVDHDRGLAAGRALFQRTVHITSWILLGVCVALMAGAALMPDAAPLLGWRWLGSDPEPVRELTIRLLPYVIFVCLSALASGALQVRGEFKVSSLAPAVLNIVWIAVLGVLIRQHGWPSAVDPLTEKHEQLEMARVLCWGVIFAGAVQLLVQVPALRAHGFLGRVRSSAGGAQTADSPVPFDASAQAWTVLKTSAPLALGAAVYQVNVMIDGLMAYSMLKTGGATAYHFATRVQQFPVALIATAATAAVFPSLKAFGHLGRKQELRGLHDRTQLAVCFLSLPACVGLIALSHPICGLLFQHGQYGATGVARTSWALSMLALAILPAGAVTLVSRAYYALGDFKTPVRISIAMIACNVALNVLFVRFLAMDAGGFALATSLTSWFNLLLLWPGLERKLDLPAPASGFFGRIARMLFAALLSGAGALLAQRAIAGAGAPGGLRAGIAVGVGMAVAVALYGALSALLGVEEWRAFLARLRRPRSGG
jgi:putative peptidoglycan lipid II flippase